MGEIQENGSKDALRDLVEQVRAKMNADRVLVTEVTSDTQYVVVQAGAHQQPALESSMPISQSICQHVIGMRFPLSIDDAECHPLLRGSAAVSQLAIGAYLGFPFGREFPALAICAICSGPRAWTSADRALLSAAIAEIRQSHAPELLRLLDRDTKG